MGKVCDKIFVCFAMLALIVICKALTYNEIEQNVYFQVFNNDTQKTWNSTFNTTFESQGCSNTTKVSFIVHGWLEGLYKSLWIPYVIRNTLKNFGGCVVVMDYSIYAAQDYGTYLVNNYYSYLQLLVKKLNHVGNMERIHMFGFSFGARLSAGAGVLFNNTNGPLIPRMDLCDPARPGFDGADPKFSVNISKAAKNTACIHTSNDYGTQVYNCHQDFLMGHCGQWQDGRLGYPKGSHGLCPYFYNATFTFNFTNSNMYNCVGVPDNTYVVNATRSAGVIVGRRNSIFPKGQIFVGTAMCYPYVVVNGTVNNVNKTTNACPNDIYLPVSKIFS